jgi:hypothetical protein
MKGNCFAFDAFGQWYEQEGNKMRWMEKVGGEWRPRLGRPTKMVGQSATYSLFPTFFSPKILFSSTTTTLVHNGGAMATWASCPGTPWRPYNRACQGESPPSSHKLASIAKVYESFSKFQVCYL